MEEFYLKLTLVLVEVDVGHLKWLARVTVGYLYGAPLRGATARYRVIAKVTASYIHGLHTLSPIYLYRPALSGRYCVAKVTISDLNPGFRNGGVALLNHGSYLNCPSLGCHCLIKVAIINN